MLPINFLISMLAIAGLGFHIQQGPQSMPVETSKDCDRVHQKSQTEAERIWEQAITAKGGRDRLYAVRNMVISTKKDTTGSFEEPSPSRRASRLSE